MAEEWDVLAQLQPASWRGVPFPVVSLEFGFEHDHADHLYPDRDGGHVEATGRNLETYSASVPFRNGVKPGAKEDFVGRALYPEVWQAFRIACLDRSAGELVHPVLGRVTVRCKSMRTRLVGVGRDGVDVEVLWKESLEDEDALLRISSEPSPVSSAVMAARDLDGMLAQVSEMPEFKNAADYQVPGAAKLDTSVSFDDMMRQIQAAFDTPTKISKQIGGAIDNVARRVDNVREAIERMNDVGLWPIVTACNHLRSSLHDIGNVLAVKQNKRIKRYVVQRPTTLASVANTLHVRLDDLMRMNPLLLEEPRLQRGTAVMYFGE